MEINNNYHFNAKLLDILRANCHKVYVDKISEDGYQFIGDENSYIGNRIRVYITDFEYEEPDIIKENSELKNYVENQLLYIIEEVSNIEDY